MNFKKRVGWYTVRFIKYVGIILGFLCNLVTNRTQRISIVKSVHAMLMRAPRRFDFLLYEFAQRFIGGVLKGESNVWFTREIYSGTMMDLDVSQYSQRQFYILKQYGSHIYNYILKNVKPGDIFFDIGANVGYFTLVASRIVGGMGHVYAFEPEGANFEKLEKNVERNGLLNVTPIQRALSDSEGTASLYINPANEGGHSLVPDTSQKEMPVPTIVFDTWVKNIDASKIRLAKIDVEGFELSVLKGMEETLKTSKGLELICEVRRNQKAVEDFMRGHGYNVYELTRDGVPVIVKDMSILKRDFLFSKNDYS